MILICPSPLPFNFRKGYFKPDCFAYPVNINFRPVFDQNNNGKINTVSKAMLSPPVTYAVTTAKICPQ